MQPREKHGIGKGVPRNHGGRKDGGNNREVMLDEESIKNFIQPV